MTELTTASGDVILVDEDDVPRLEGQRFYSLRTRRLTYAAFVLKVPGEKSKRMLLHRFLLDAPPGTIVDHKNRNGLDNRRENLRFADHKLNAANGSGWGGTSKYRGVFWNKQARRWTAQITLDQACERIGNFQSEEDAARAFDAAAVAAWGEFARINFPGEPLIDLAQMRADRERKFRGSSKYRGVSWDTVNGRWMVRFHSNGKTVCPGRFDDEEEAARVYDAAALAALGDKAKLNFPRPAAESAQ